MNVDQRKPHVERAEPVGQKKPERRKWPATGVEYVERPLGEALERGLQGKPHPQQELGGSRVVEDAARRALGRNSVPVREDGAVPIQSFVRSAGHCGREKQRMNVARSLAEIGKDIRPQKGVREPVEDGAVAAWRELRSKPCLLDALFIRFGPRKLELRSFSDSPENRMNIHHNARLTPLGRERMVRAIVEGRQMPQAAARAAGVCPRTARKWVARFKAEGLAGLADRRHARSACDSRRARPSSIR